AKRWRPNWTIEAADLTPAGFTALRRCHAATQGRAKISTLLGSRREWPFTGLALLPPVDHDVIVESYASPAVVDREYTKFAVLTGGVFCEGGALGPELISAPGVAHLARRSKAASCSLPSAQLNLVSRVGNKSEGDPRACRAQSAS